MNNWCNYIACARCYWLGWDKKKSELFLDYQLAEGQITWCGQRPDRKILSNFVSRELITTCVKKVSDLCE